MDQPTARSVALGAAALSHSGQSVPPAELIAEAETYVSWILGTPGPLAQLTLTIQGAPMPITIDSVNALAILSFEDRDGDPVAPPAGALAVATSSNPSVLTVGAAAAGAGTSGVADLQFALTPVSAGTAALSVHATAADGTPLLGPSGTAIPDPAPVTVTVNPGAAAAEMFTVPGA